MMFFTGFDVSCRCRVVKKRVRRESFGKGPNYKCGLVHF